MEKKKREKADRKRKTRWPGSKFSTLGNGEECNLMHCFVYFIEKRLGENDEDLETKVRRFRHGGGMRGDAISRFETINFPIFFKKKEVAIICFPAAGLRTLATAPTATPISLASPVWRRRSPATTSQWGIQTQV